MDNNRRRKRRKTRRMTVVNKTRFATFCIVSFLTLAFIFLKIFVPALNKQLTASSSQLEDLERTEALREISNETQKQKYRQPSGNEAFTETETEKSPKGEYHDMLPSVAGDYVYYNQEDIRWANKTYGPEDPIGTHGCGPTLMASLISTLTGEDIDPVQMSNWAYENGYLAPGNGSLHSLIPETAWAYGLNAESLYYPSAEEIEAHLRAGRYIVMVSGHGVFSDEDGHFIALIDIDDQGMVKVSDSVEYPHIKKSWYIQGILDEASPVSSAGGPFWAIWK